MTNAPLPVACDSRDRPEDRLYRGYPLPKGLTRECFDELAEILNFHQREECDDSDGEGAIKVFLAVQRHAE
jgi:hypothetical protein